MAQTSSFFRMPLAAEMRRFWTDLTELARLHRRLAQSELSADAAALKRLVIVAGSGAVMALSGLPLLLLLLAEGLATWMQLDRRLCLAVMGSVLVLSGPLLIWLAVRRFRRQFTALEQTRAELSENVRWLQEWSQADVDASESE